VCSEKDGSYPSKTILAFGDSLSEGFYDKGRKLHPYTIKLTELLKSNHLSSSFELVNEGISGETVEHMVPRFQRLLGSSTPVSVAIILGGTNNLGARNPQKIFESLRAMYEFAGLKKVLVFPVTLPEHHLETTWDWIADTRKSVNNMIRDYSADHKLKVIDLAKGIPQLGLTPKEYVKFWDDGVHFNPGGYDKFGELVFEVISNDLRIMAD